MSKIRQSAKGETCTLKILGVCNYNPETVVLAHVGNHGSAKRNHDDEAVYACSNCHDAIDGRTRTFFSDDKGYQGVLWRIRKGYIDDAKAETQRRLIAKGLLPK